MSVQGRINYATVPWGGRDLVPVQRVADSSITLLPVRDARRQNRSGTVDILSPDEWNRIQSFKGSGFDVDEAYVRT